MTPSNVCGPSGPLLVIHGSVFEQPGVGCQELLCLSHMPSFCQPLRCFVSDKKSRKNSIEISGSFPFANEDVPRPSKGCFLEAFEY